MPQSLLINVCRGIIGSLSFRPSSLLILVGLIGGNILANLCTLLNQFLQLLLVFQVLRYSFLLHTLFLNLVQFSVLDDLSALLRILNFYDSLLIFLSVALQTQHSCNFQFLFLAAFHALKHQLSLLVIFAFQIIITWLLN